MNGGIEILCPKCGSYAHNGRDNFCASCGHRFEAKDRVKRIGELRDEGVYRISMEAFEAECNCEPREGGYLDSLVGRHATAVLIKLKYPRETHPYLCGYCGKRVSDSTDGKCDTCAQQLWVERTDESEARWCWNMESYGTAVNCTCGLEVWTDMPECPKCRKPIDEIVEAASEDDADDDD
ncbi:TPA: hypothetical protein DF272_05835 [Candidatus Falkowbacteria bacterium]|nr:hypothetical protein [Candidatus Falkowbacteria bacterium]